MTSFANKMQIFLLQVATVIPIKGTRTSVNMPGFKTKSLTITIVIMIFESSHAILWLVLHTCSAKADFERETDRKLAFLDTCVHRTIEGKLDETDVYRKPTHTDKYLSFNSNHPRSHKKSVAATLLQESRKFNIKQRW